MADNIPPYLEDAARQLRYLGWTLWPPPEKEMPMPEVGQVWRSPRPKVEPRKVVSVGVDRSYGAGIVVRYTVPSRERDPRCVPRPIFIGYWKRWARAMGARPE